MIGLRFQSLMASYECEIHMHGSSPFCRENKKIYIYIYILCILSNCNAFEIVYVYVYVCMYMYMYVLYMYWCIDIFIY